jgi:hypothetical protein
MISLVYEVARYVKILIRYNVLMSRKLQYSAALWSQRYQINQVVLYLFLKKDIASWSYFVC